MTAYHISLQSNIKKFNISKVGTGMGTSFYGYGLYFALDKKTCEDYYRKMPKNREYYIYKVKIADNGIYDENDKLTNGNTALEQYAQLVDKLGSEEAATREIVKNGVNGIKYFSHEDGNSVVMYVDTKIKILDVARCS
jgi:hypothetical protein